MNAPDFVWSDDSYAAQRLEFAIAGSKSAILRVQGMKAAAAANPPTQINLAQRFPYPGHKTCAEWSPLVSRTGLHPPGD